MSQIIANKLSSASSAYLVHLGTKQLGLVAHYSEHAGRQKMICWRLARGRGEMEGAWTATSDYMQHEFVGVSANDLLGSLSVAHLVPEQILLRCPALGGDLSPKMHRELCQQFGLAPAAAEPQAAFVDEDEELYAMR